jgi:hypothetical protein
MMREQPSRDSVVGERLVRIAHSQYSTPEFVVEGIGPASFRSHYLTLSNGLVLDAFTPDIAIASLPLNAMPGETAGIPPDALIGRAVAAVVRDDTESTLVILDGGIFLKDANDGFYGNPLQAGRLTDHYSELELSNFTDYWSHE